jgi:S-formylglutathione hydrolase FrmB
MLFIFEGTEDEYLKTLNPDRLVTAAAENPKGKKVISVNLRMHNGKDHSFNFVKHFWKDHFGHHGRILFLESQGL